MLSTSDGRDLKKGSMKQKEQKNTEIQVNMMCQKIVIKAKETLNRRSKHTRTITT